ncbi:hypothetical protein GALMADRAFT_231427 [Galerina marginata CBS 339.88]|uniref:Uncharacterized protein n=1 Tax=Galerina marginata (strain CBS 339.88) TaxID=685588 RepID=A0A067SES1_GALM3|nr:hypothetical protein GALMADRAFT_231427 [Galerina marginata CBS 339.88]
MSAYPPTYPSSYAQQHQQQQSQQQRPYVMAQPPPSWAQPPPFAGAPPIPPGVSVNPQQWQAGVWQINPAYKHNRNPQQQQQQQQQHVPWIPSHHWMPSAAQAHQPQAQQPPSSGQSSQSSQQASYNPFKRQPRAPSAEYLATKLSDNPLGLSNLTPATVEEYYRQGHQTPWIWKPRELSDEEDPTPSKQRHATDPTSNGSSPSQSRRHSESDVDQQPESFTSKIELQPTFSSKIVRTPDHYRNDSAHSSSPSSHRSSRSSIDSQLSSRMASLSTGSSSNTSAPLTRQSTMPLTSSSSFSSYYSSSPTKMEFASAPMLTDHLSDEPDSMLSPLILTKTPMLAPPSNLRSVRNHHPNPLLATQSLDTIVELPSAPPSQQFGASATTSTHPPQQHQQQGGNGAYNAPSFSHANTMPNLPKTQLSYPPQMPVFPPPMPIPKNLDREAERDRDRERERDHRERPDRERDWERDRERLGTRHTTYVDPHVSSAATTPSPRSHGPSRPSSRPSSRQSSAHASPVHASNTTPPTYPTYPISSPPGSANPYPQQSGLTSPSNGYSGGPSMTSPTYPSKLSNPLPAPPQMSARIPIPPGEIPNTSANLSHSDYKSSKSNRIPLIMPVQKAEPAQYHERRRHGYWNQRGDHLTPNGYIVYAPPDRAYPDDLKTYPPVTEGYQDHNGKFASHCLRPELPQSLPRHGQPPEIPYDAFIIWEWIV